MKLNNYKNNSYIKQVIKVNNKILMKMMKLKNNYQFR